MSEDNNEREGYIIAFTVPGSPQSPWPELQLWDEYVYMDQREAGRQSELANEAARIESLESSMPERPYSVYKITKVE
ncbi:hypothetical protein SEA_CAMERICO_64 [Gordonia phage Camerico]|nr:hypothetical protein SEA_CAMERICO_64 [Gordonia phage Camerico]